MLNSIKDEGIILSARNFRENDKILDIFLANNGIISAVAFGAKKSKKRFGGNIDPYNLATFEIQKGKKGYYLKEVAVKKIFTNIKQEISTITILFNISKLILAKQLNINQSIYRALQKLLIRMEDEKKEIEKFYLFFLIYFLRKEGIFSDLRCLKCNTYDVNHLAYDNDSLVFLCNKCCYLNLAYSLTEEQIDFLRACLNADKLFKDKIYLKTTYVKIEQLLIDYIKKNFNVILEQITEKHITYR